MIGGEDDVCLSLSLLSVYLYFCSAEEQGMVGAYSKYLLIVYYSVSYSLCGRSPGGVERSPPSPFPHGDKKNRLKRNSLLKPSLPMNYNVHCRCCSAAP